MPSARAVPYRPRMRPPSAARPAALVALVALHATLVALALARALDPLFNDAKHRLGPGTDFLAYYNAGAASARGLSPYGLGPGFGFRYHPLFASAFGATLASLPPTSAWWAWCALLEATLLALVAYAWRTLAAPQRVPAAAILLLGAPYLLELYMGNATFLAFAALFAALLCEERNRRGAGAALYALSLLVKPVGLVLAPWYLLRRRWHALGALAAVAALAAPTFLTRPGAWRQFVEVNVDAIPAPGWVIHAGNQGLHNLLADVFARAAGVPTATLATFDALPVPARVVLPALPVAYAAAALAADRRHGLDFWRGVALWAGLYPCAYKDVWEHSYAMAPLVLYAMHRAGLWSRLTTALAVPLTAPTLFALYDVPLPPGPIDPEHHWSAAVALLHHATRSLPMLALCAEAALRPAPPDARA